MDSPHDLPPATDLWNRSTTGDPVSDRPGDVAIAHALRFLGPAENGGVLHAIEMGLAEGWGVESQDAFAWFGLDDVKGLIETTTAAYDRLVGAELSGDARTDAEGEIEIRADSAWHRMDVETRLTTALEREAGRRPDAFAPESDAARPTADHGAWADPPDAAAEPLARLPFAVDISEAERSRRTIDALNAFGFTASETEGRVLLQPWTDEEDPLLHAVFSLIDQRYPPA